jgi:uncharacterized membrane protein
MFAVENALIAHAVAAAISSGMMLVFSNSILPAFDRLPPAEAVAAMQGINVSVINPLFLGLFLGTGLTAAALAGVHAWQAGLHASSWMLLAAGIYVVGVVFVIVGGNVPLNDALAVLVPERVSAQDWRDYTRPWIRWNNVRAGAAAASSWAFVVAAVRLGAGG